ncbi:MAG TPA: ABC transporter permease [Anaerolineaceae bacterium]|nr:ABC transporter permease [Anaerolineaceae bacterium]
MEISLKRSQKNNSLKNIAGKYGGWLMPISGTIAVILWWLITRWSELPAFILPSPMIVLRRFFLVINNGSLIWHTSYTLLEVFLGLISGAFLATVLGYLLAKSSTLERLLSPYLVASQAIPIVAIAPLLVIWFGPGLFSKVLIAGLIVFFPVLVNTVVGIRAVPQDLRDLMRSLRATRLQTLRFLEIPAALPVFLGGLRVGATLSVIGAVVGEFVGADRGLGFLINVGRGQYDTALVFVAVFTLIAMALLLYGAVILLERKLLAWQHRPRKNTLTVEL